MDTSLVFRAAGSLLVLCTLCAGPAAGIEAVMGETIPLEGYSSGSMYVYLFLTGPNLPVNGVPLNDVTKQADQGYFTRVTVDSNDHWSYTWNTASVNGRLDAGTYTVWVVNSPNDRSNLQNADYRTLSVTLGTPSLSVDRQQQNGALEVSSSPSGASVSINGQYRGRTPFTAYDVPAGQHTVTFALDGHYGFSAPVLVQAGKISEVSATLVPVQETAAPASPAPVVTTGPPTTHAAAVIPAGLAAMIVILALAGRRR